MRGCLGPLGRGEPEVTDVSSGGSSDEWEVEIEWDEDGEDGMIYARYKGENPFTMEMKVTQMADLLTAIEEAMD